MDPLVLRAADFSILALWVLWLVAWFVAARSTARTVVRQSLAARFAHLVFLWGGAVLLFMQPQRLKILQDPLLPRSGWIAWGGVALVVLGLGFAGWARAHLGRFWSGTVTLKAEHALIRSGPYGLTRHPIYTGMLLALTGTAVARGTLAALVGLLLVTVGILLKIFQEERLLLEHFGDTYRGYRAEVPALIPRLRPR